MICLPGLAWQHSQETIGVYRKLDFTEGLPSQNVLNRMLQKEFRAAIPHQEVLHTLQKVTGPLILLLLFDRRATLKQ